MSLVRQLEHRLDGLDALARELDERRHTHLREAESAREQLARPFRYAEDLARARQRQAAITEQMQARQAAEPGGAEPSTPGGGLDAQTAEALQLARLAQAHPVDQALHASAVAARPARSPSTTPSRRPGPRR